MKIHEYQAKEFLKKFGVPVPEGNVAFSVEEAVAIAKQVGLPVVIKAQIHAGGRGKGGGIKTAKTVEEARRHAQTILGMKLVTHQTGPEGKIVKKLLIEKGCSIKKEYYLGVTLDRSPARVTIIACGEGGVEIEEVASRHPEKIFKMPIDPFVGVPNKESEKIARELGFSGDPTRQFVTFVKALYEGYLKGDCTLVEINPLVETKEGELIALDAKVSFDDNALFRHPEYESMRDLGEEDPKEIEAKKSGLSYIRLNGNVGCLVNGAGLAMATMDIIKLAGGEPANFLDVGGGATALQVSQAFKIILADQRVKSILVNIFGGIMKCDTIAEGIVSAAREIHIKVPTVVRLQGTNVDLGKRILKDSGLNLIAEDDLGKAASIAVQQARNPKYETRNKFQ